MAFGIGRAGFQAHHVRVVELQFGHILDCHQAFTGADLLAQDVEQSGLAGAGATADQDVATAGHSQLEEVEDGLVNRAHGQQVGAFEHVLAKLSDRQAWPVQGNRRNDRVDPAAIGHARIDHG
ncbi:hypothetical protein D9M73_218560 [compost metagenome]